MNEAIRDAEAVLACHGLTKTYQGPQPVPVLHGVELEVHRGERIAIMGRSGSGKSTLLHVLGGLDTPTSGAVFVKGRAFTEMSEVERGQTRSLEALDLRLRGRVVGQLR